MSQRAARAPLTKRDETVYEAVNTLATYHISAVRRRKNGEITQVKHITWGWLPVKEYYNLQKAHELGTDFFKEFVKGGYELKAWLWNTQLNAEILGFDAGIPFGLLVVGVALTLFLAHDGHPMFQALDLAALALPWGELYYLIYIFYALQALNSAPGGLNILAPGPAGAINFWEDVYNEQASLGTLATDAVSKALNSAWKWLNSPL